MALRAICDADADNSYLYKHCSSSIDCCSPKVGFVATGVTTNRLRG
jgi:hypothetical protein